VSPVAEFVGRHDAPCRARAPTTAPLHRHQLPRTHAQTARTQRDAEPRVPLHLLSRRYTETDESDPAIVVVLAIATRLLRLEDAHEPKPAGAAAPEGEDEASDRGPARDDKRGAGALRAGVVEQLCELRVRRS
jgi:hypothetical protein